MLNKLPSESFAVGSGNTIVGAVEYLLSDNPTRDIEAILLTFGFPGTEPNKLDQLLPFLLIVIASPFNLPSESKAIDTTGATPVSPSMATPLNVKETDEPVYPNPGSSTVKVLNIPFNEVAVPVAVIPVNVCVEPTPRPVILISVPPEVADNDIALPVIVLTKYVVPETKPPIAVPVVE